MPSGAESSTAIRSLLGTTGAFAIAQPVATPLEPEADLVAGAPARHPGEAITDARVGTARPATRPSTSTFAGPAATALADATAAHVGEYLPIALDGVAIAVPVIESQLPDGRVQVALSSDDSTSAGRLAAILQAGPLPLPVEVVTP